MTNKILDEYLDRLRSALAALPADERDAVLAETRSHLEEAIHARLRMDPSAGRGRVTLEETVAFGDPAEIAAARGAASQAAAKRPRRWPRWASYGVAVVVVLLVAVVAIDLVNKPAQYTAYQRDNVLEAHTASVNDTFEVRPRTQTLAVTIVVERESGCAGVRITDPTGEVVLDQWDACGDVRRSVEAKPSLTGRVGEWRVEVRHRDFTGSILVHARGTLE